MWRHQMEKSAFVMLIPMSRMGSSIRTRLIAIWKRVWPMSCCSCATKALKDTMSRVPQSVVLPINKTNTTWDIPLPFPVRAIPAMSLIILVKFRNGILLMDLVAVVM